jgi:RNA polymerase sigma-70 factor (ECF subfamily)
MTALPVAESLKHLLALAQAGDSSALGRLLAHYQKYLELLARLQLRSRLQGKADPADLVQETFLKAHRHFAEFRGATEREWTAWLRQILATSAANLVRHYLGNRGRDLRLERDLADAFSESSRCMESAFAFPQSTPSQQAAHREQAVLLAEALALLPDDYREAVILRHLECLTFPEVAHRMGRSMDSVKKLWARGLARLRDLMRIQS